MPTKHSVSHQRSKHTKHIGVKYHFDRSQIESEIIQVTYLPTAEKISDIFTTLVSGLRFNTDVRTHISVRNTAIVSSLTNRKDK